MAYLLCPWRRRVLALVTIVILVAACGQPASSPSAVSLGSKAVYITADQDHLAVLHWQKYGEHELRGEWISLKMPDLRLLVLVKPLKTFWSGHIQDGTTVSMTVSGALLQAKVEAQRLFMSGTNPAGYFQRGVWDKITQEQANHYRAAFDAYAQARLAFALLKRTVENLPLDSSVYAYASRVGSAERYVRGLREKRDRVKGLSQVCGSGVLSQFRLVYPPDGSQFTLSAYERSTKTEEQNAQETVKQSTLSKHLAGFERVWQQATGMRVPEVREVPLSWRIDPEGLVRPPQKESTTSQGKAILSQLETALKVDYQSMKTLKQEAEKIASEVEHLASQQGCP